MEIVDVLELQSYLHEYLRRIQAERWRAYPIRDYLLPLMMASVVGVGQYLVGGRYKPSVAVFCERVLVFAYGSGDHENGKLYFYEQRTSIESRLPIGKVELLADHCIGRFVDKGTESRFLFSEAGQ